MKRAAAACIAAALFAGEAAAEPMARMAVEGEQRRYLLHAPGAAPAPLIVALHADGQSARAMRRDMRLDAEAAARGWAVVYPQGRLNTWASSDDPEALRGGRAAKVDDIAFLDALIASLEARRVAQEGQVFLAGYGRGAMMAYRYACERSDRIVGFAMVAPAAGEDGADCTPRVASAVLTIMGEGAPDPAPGAEGLYPRRGEASLMLATLMLPWFDRGGCGVPSVLEGTRAELAQRWMEEAARPDDWVWTDVPSCAAPMRTILLMGAGHYWPGAAEPENLVTRGPRPTSMNAAAMIAGFVEEAL